MLEYPVTGCVSGQTWENCEEPSHIEALAAAGWVNATITIGAKVLYSNQNGCEGWVTILSVFKNGKVRCIDEEGGKSTHYPHDLWSKP